MFERQFNILIDPDFLFNFDNSRKNLPITPEDFVNGVRTNIVDIAKTRTGKVVLHTLKLWNNFVRIQPWDRDPKVCPPGGALTDKQGLRDTQWNRLLPILGLVPDDFRKPIRALITYLPQSYAPGGGCYTRNADRDFSDFNPTPELVLLHELVHAVRLTSSTFIENNRETFEGTRLNKYENEEEFNAVLVESIYQSELKGHIRNAHNAHWRDLEAELQDSFEFFKVSRKAFFAIDKFCKSNPHFTPRLCAIDVPFNPIRAYFHNRKKCEAFSNSIDAARHDNALVQGLGIISPSVPAAVWDRLL